MNAAGEPCAEYKSHKATREWTGLALRSSDRRETRDRGFGRDPLVHPDYAEYVANPTWQDHHRDIRDYGNDNTMSCMSRSMWVSSLTCGT